MKPSSRLLILIVCLSMWMPVAACLNGYEGQQDNADYKARKSFPIPIGHAVKTTGLISERAKFEKGDFGGSLNYSVLLIYDGQYEEAEKVCRAIEKNWPDEYSPAANLGTILEVNGKNKEALKWIKRGMEIYPSSHDSSEWIHVKILEAKLNPDVAWTGAIMTGVDFGQDAMPSLGNDTADLKKLQNHLFYQLNERVTFIEPKDTFIAALMFELGNVTLARKQYADAKSIYEIAKDYGFAEPLLAARMAYIDAHFKQMDAQNKAKQAAAQQKSKAENASEKRSFPWILVAILALGGAVATRILGKRMMKK